MNNMVDPSKSVSYTYDDIYRLERVSGGYSSNYIYDADGNILTKNEDQNLTLTYIPSDSVASHGPKSVNGRLLRYDPNGNLIEDAFSNLKIVYDYDNRPVEIRKLDSNILIAKYYYDGEGKRVKKEVYTNNSLSKTTEYINQYYEKEQPVGGTLVVRKFYAGAAYRENGTLTYTTTDHLSSTTLLTNTSGGKVADYRYYPYGSPIVPPNPLPPNSWIGQKLDTESGLYFLNARYYSPSYGRFVQKDIGSDPTGKGNGYLYARNNPISGRDSNGGFCDYGDICALDLAGALAGAVWSGIVDSAGRMSIDAQYYLNNHNTPGKEPERIAAIIDFATLGQASRTVEAWNRNSSTIYNGDLSIEERLPAAFDAGVNITGLAAQVPGTRVAAQGLTKMTSPIKASVKEAIHSLKSETMVFTTNQSDRFSINIVRPEYDPTRLALGYESRWHSIKIPKPWSRSNMSPKDIGITKEWLQAERAKWQLRQQYIKAGYDVDPFRTPQAGENDWVNMSWGDQDGFMTGVVDDNYYSNPAFRTEDQIPFP